MPDELTAKFWAGAQRGALTLQACSSCERYVHPPRPSCPHCNSGELGYVDVSGGGHVWSWMVTRRPAVQGFPEAPPYLLVLVELVEQPGLMMLSDMPAAKRGRLAIGAAVTVTFDQVGGDDGPFVLPRFVLAGD